jgi:hypothetical protein
MRPLWLAMALPMLASAGPACAQAKTDRPPRFQFQPIAVERAERTPDFQIYAEDWGRKRSNGFIASVAVSQRATVGFGRFYSVPRRRVAPHDQPVSLQTRKTRRAAIGLSLSF